jgi:hypothetical protein
MDDLYYFVEAGTVEDSGEINPSWRALVTAAMRVRTPSFRYAPESRLRTVECEMDIFDASSAVELSG